MRSLELNLASRPFRNNTLLWIAHVLLGVGVIAFTAWNTTTFLETGRRLRELRTNVGSIESRIHDVETREHRVAVEIGKHDLKYLATQTVRANDVIQRKALSWTQLFNRLEEVQPYEVKMVSIRPVFGAASQGQIPTFSSRSAEDVVPVSVEGSARDLNAFLDFERALIDDPHFDRVEPERTTHTKTGELNFGLAFLYFPEGQAEKKANPQPLARVAVPEKAEEEPEGEDAQEDSPVEEREPANVKEAWGGVPQKPGAAPLPSRPPAVPSPAPARAVPTAAKPPAKPAEGPTRDASDAAAGDEGKPAAAPKFRMPVHDVPNAPLRKRPENWQPPASPPPPKENAPDGTGERG